MQEQQAIAGHASEGTIRTMACCSLGSGLVIVLSLLLPPHGQGRPRISIGSLVCRAGAACRPSLAVLPPMDWGARRFLSADEDLQRLRVILNRFLWRLGRGEAPTILHVGPNALAQREIAEYAVLLGLAQGACRLIFVEPLGRQLARLQRRMHETVKHGNHTLKLVHAAVCPGRAATVDTTLYTFSRKFLEDFPQAPGLADVFGDLSSLSWGQFIESIQRFEARRKYPQMSAEAWAASPYVRKMPVRCITPSALLAEVGLRPGDVDYFISDTEGFDSQIVPAFLALGQFSPPALQFEYVNQRLDANTTFTVVKQLATRGYEVHAHDIDVIALASMW